MTSSGPETAVYIDHIGVKVIEEDDIDPDDVGVGRIPAVGVLAGAPGIAEMPDPDGTVRVRLGIDVDDGSYEFRATILPAATIRDRLRASDPRRDYENTRYYPARAAPVQHPRRMN